MSHDLIKLSLSYILLFWHHCCWICDSEKLYCDFPWFWYFFSIERNKGTREIILCLLLILCLMLLLESGHSACSHKSSYWQPGIFGNKEIDATLRVCSLLFRTGSGCSKMIWGFSCIGLSLTSLFFRFTYYLYVCFVTVSLLF